MEFVTVGASRVAFAPGVHNWMVGPNDAPRFRINGVLGGWDVPLRKGGHEFMRPEISSRMAYWSSRQRGLRSKTWEGIGS